MAHLCEQQCDATRRLFTCEYDDYNVFEMVCDLFPDPIDVDGSKLYNSMTRYLAALDVTRPGVEIAREVRKLLMRVLGLKAAQLDGVCAEYLVARTRLNFTGPKNRFGQTYHDRLAEAKILASNRTYDALAKKAPKSKFSTYEVRVIEAYALSFFTARFIELRGSGGYSLYRKSVICQRRKVHV